MVPCALRAWMAASTARTVQPRRGERPRGSACVVSCVHQCHPRCDSIGRCRAFVSFEPVWACIERFCCWWFKGSQSWAETVHAIMTAAWLWLPDMTDGMLHISRGYILHVHLGNQKKLDWMNVPEMVYIMGGILILSPWSQQWSWLVAVCCVLSAGFSPPCFCAHLGVSHWKTGMELKKLKLKEMSSCLKWCLTLSKRSRRPVVRWKHIYWISWHVTTVYTDDFLTVSSRFKSYITRATILFCFVSSA